MIVFALLLCACVSPSPLDGTDGFAQGDGAALTLPHQARAIEIVWNRTYLRLDDPPRIEWVQLNTLLTDGESPPLIDGVNYYGVYEPLTDTAKVRWLGRFATSAFSHELIHAWLFRATGDADAAHTMHDYWIRENEAVNALGGFEGL